MKKINVAAICLVVAVCLMGWAVGVATDLFASPAFSSFWWIGYESAHYIEFTALAIGGAVLVLAISFWSVRKNEDA